VGSRADAKDVAMPVKRPQGNSLVLAILRSPVHRLLSGMAIELRYTGRRSGRRYVLPVQYAREAERLVVVPQDANSKTWWRNLLTPQPVSVRLNGRLRDATARVVHPDNPAWQEEKRLYERRWRRLSGRLAGPIVEITLRGQQ
jgi:deazaflavin-dependent oxidoreductase (nitroreductase family)